MPYGCDFLVNKFLPHKSLCLIWFHDVSIQNEFLNHSTHNQHCLFRTHYEMSLPPMQLISIKAQDIMTYIKKLLIAITTQAKLQFYKSDITS